MKNIVDYINYRKGVRMGAKQARALYQPTSDNLVCDGPLSAASWARSVPHLRGSDRCSTC
jgi:hypothetical protein